MSVEEAKKKRKDTCLKEEIDALIESAPAQVQRSFSCDCAERALRRVGATNARLWFAVEAGRRFAEGKVDLDELAAARTAACIDTDVKITAASIAARNAAHPESGPAARYAAFAARSNAMTTNASWYTEAEWQIAHLRSLVAAQNEARSSLLFAIQQRADGVQEALPRHKEALEGALFT